MIVLDWGLPDIDGVSMLRSLREFLQWRLGDSIILAEANVLPDTDMEYFGDDGDRVVRNGRHENAAGRLGCKERQLFLARIPLQLLREQ